MIPIHFSRRKAVLHLVPLAAALLLTACGGGEDGSGGASGTPHTASMALSTSACAASVGTNTAYVCTLASSLPGPVTWTLAGAPTGMVIQPGSGALHWTPLSSQTGTYTVQASASNGSQSESTTFVVTVTAGAADPVGLHVAPNGDDRNDGSATRPLRTVARAVKLVTPGKTIYLRGGEYRNAEYGTDWSTRTLGSLAQISVAGTASAPITLRPLGNEYVRLVSDVNALSLKSAHYWTIQGLEIVGNAAALDRPTAMALWWSDDARAISGRGIASNGSTHLTIADCIIHDFPAAGITATEGDHFQIRDNIVYNNAWWSTGGVHGISAATLVTASDADAEQETLQFTGNLAFANQSLVISHVFSKGYVTLDIDEGNGLHLQNNTATFRGKARVANNVMLFNGKAGLGINTMDRVTVVNNASYRNARVVDTGELALQTTTASSIADNLFQPRPERTTIRDFSKAFANVGRNATTGALGDTTVIAGLTTVSAVFASAGTGDFSAAPGLPADMGVPAADLLRINARLAEYAIHLTEPTQVVDDTYMATMKAAIFASWPASYGTLVLNDRATGYSYTYAQRCHFPGAPGSTPCP